MAAAIASKLGSASEAYRQIADRMHKQKELREKALYLADTLGHLEDIVRTDPSVETSAGATLQEKLVDTIDYARSLLSADNWYTFFKGGAILKELEHRAEVLKTLESTFKLSLMSENNREQKQVSDTLAQVLALLQPGQHPFWLKHFRADTRIERHELARALFDEVQFGALSQLKSIPDTKLMAAVGVVLSNFFWSGDGKLSVNEFEKAMNAFVDPTKMLRSEVDRLTEAQMQLTKEQEDWLHLIRKQHRLIKERQELDFKRTAYVYRMHSLVAKPGGKPIAFLDYGKKINVGTELLRHDGLVYLEASVDGQFGWAIATSVASEAPPPHGIVRWSANPARERVFADPQLTKEREFMLHFRTLVLQEAPQGGQKAVYVPLITEEKYPCRVERGYCAPERLANAVPPHGKLHEVRSTALLYTSELDSLTKWKLEPGTVVVVTGVSEDKTRVRVYHSVALPRCWLNSKHVRPVSAHPDV